MCSLAISQLLLYQSVVFAAVVAMDAVDIIRLLLLLLLLFLLWRFTRTHKSVDVLCAIWCILGTFRRCYGSVYACMYSLVIFQWLLYIITSISWSKSVYLVFYIAHERIHEFFLPSRLGSLCLL